MKNYTAALVLQQVEAGNLSLDDTLDSFGLGFSAEFAEDITIEQLLHHTSGFPGAYVTEYTENQLAYGSIRKRLNLMLDTELEFIPGTDRLYSNYGYVVLGAILEETLGKPFHEILFEKVFEPLGLEDSVYPYDGARENQSRRYSYSYNGEQNFVGVTEHHGPDGGIEANARDVLSFYRSLFYSDELLSRESAEFKGYFTRENPNWSAYGGGVGVSAAVEINLEKDIQVIVLSNSDSLVAELLSQRIIQYIDTGEYADIQPPPEVFAWTTYKTLGAESFRTNFSALYTEANYDQFIGRTLNGFAMELIADDRWQPALDVLNCLKENFPRAPQVFDSLAFYWLQRGDIESAQQQFDIALDLNPSFRSDYSVDNYSIN